MCLLILLLSENMTSFVRREIALMLLQSENHTVTILALQYSENTADQGQKCTEVVYFYLHCASVGTVDSFSKQIAAFQLIFNFVYAFALLRSLPDTSHYSWREIKKERVSHTRYYPSSSFQNTSISGQTQCSHMAHTLLSDKRDI